MHGLDDPHQLVGKPALDSQNTTCTKVSKVGCPAQARIQIDIRRQSASGWLETCWNRISPRFLGIIIPTPACSKDAVGCELTYHRCRGGQGCRVDAKHGGAAGTQEMLGRILPVAILRCYCKMCQDASWKVFWQSKMLESARVRVCQDTEGVGGEIRPHFMKQEHPGKGRNSASISSCPQSGPVSHLADISIYEWPPNTELVFRSDTPQMKPWWNYSVGLS